MVYLIRILHLYKTAPLNIVECLGQGRKEQQFAH